MELEVYNHKVALISSSEEEFSELKRALRIWYRDRFGGLQNHILLNFKEKSFPSGYLETVLEKLKKKNIIPAIKDKRSLSSPRFFFNKKGQTPELWDHQKEALLEIEKSERGIIESATGSGKSLIILEAFLQKRVKTLIIVPTITIQKSLKELFEKSVGKKNVSTIVPKEFSFLEKEIEGKKMGVGSSYFEDVENLTQKKTKIGSSYVEERKEKLEESFLKNKEKKKYEFKKRYNGLERKVKDYPVTILCFQSLDACPDEFLRSIECVIVDECHHASSASIRRALLKMPKAGYRYGFSATPWRDKNEDEMLLISALGYKRLYQLEGGKAVELNLVVRPKYEIIQSPTPEKYLADIKNWREILERGIIGNKTRNVAIVNRALSLFEEGKNVLICVDEISHLEILKERLIQKKLSPLIIHSQLPDKERESAIAHISDTKEPCISIATMSIGEGADLVSVNAVILASGGKGSIRLLQRIGRGMRLAEGKTEVIVVDFNDWFNKTLSSHSRARKKHFSEVFLVKSS